MIEASAAEQKITGNCESFKEAKVTKSRIGMAIFLGFLAASLTWLSSTPTDAAETKLTMDAIMQGAKKEGKLPWATNLVEEEVVALNKAFQRSSLSSKALNTRACAGRKKTKNCCRKCRPAFSLSIWCTSGRI
jgi:hypothetical protein